MKNKDFVMKEHEDLKANPFQEGGHDGKPLSQGTIRKSHDQAHTRRMSFIFDRLPKLLILFLVNKLL